MSTSTKPAGCHLHAELVGEGPLCFISHGGSVRVFDALSRWSAVDPSATSRSRRSYS